MNTLYLVRHGENPANLTKEMSYRRVDYSLTEKGLLQAQQTAAHFIGRGIDEIYTSPLKRAYETAQIIAETLDLPCTVVEDFREVNVGSLEGQPVTESLWMTHNQIIHGWFAGQTHLRFPDGETMPELVERFTLSLQPILKRGPGRRIILVGHGGTFLFSAPTLCPQVSFADLIKIENTNCSISEIHMPDISTGFSGQLQRWAYSGHLSGYAAEFVSGVPRPGELRQQDG